MAIKYHQTGQMASVVSMRNTGCGLESAGYWDLYPSTTYGPSTGLHMIFRTKNSGSLVGGPKGWVTYQLATGETIKLTFNAPHVTGNTCGIEISAVTRYTARAENPGTGASPYYKYHIANIQTKDFEDHKILSDFLLDAEKCALISHSDMVRYLGGNKMIDLQYVFNQNELPHMAKIWCATNDLFLTPRSKGMLTLSLAKKSMELMSKSSRKKQSGVLADVIDFSESMLSGDFTNINRHKLMEELDAFSNSIRPDKSRDLALISVVRCILDDNLVLGWRNAVDSYLTLKEPKGLKERQRDIVSIVKEKL